MSLDKWQKRMEQHFSTLAERRAAMGLPIFALEHSLTDTELDEIAEQLRVRLQAGIRLAPHWILWTMYAAEQGYTYEGGEYWQSFEDATPGWNSSDRYRVSAWFLKFQKIYNGVKPSGSWAGHFRIIAWPITHAILPRYLQNQFAKTLYELRFMLARLPSIEPAVIGRLIANNAHNVSTRFEQFLQQEELVGRIVLALLHRDIREGEEPLLSATLERIVSDLERARHARDWLRETSNVVTGRFSGIGQGIGPRFRDVGVKTNERLDQESRPDVRPGLRLRYSGDERWTLVIDVPSFKEIAALSQDIREFLRRTRCWLNGAHGKQPAGWLLSGNRRAVLKVWPDPSRPLVRFEESNGTIDHLLESECRISAGPIWLFRIGSDGIACEIVSRLVRPGREYILTSCNPLEDLLAGMSPCAIDCEGAYAIRISIPQDVTTAYMDWFRARNIAIARTIRVWPAGLPGRQWDGEGRSEYLTTERPIFGIVHDHPVDSYQVTLDEGTPVTLDAGASGYPTFIQLPKLGVGAHQLRVRALRSAALEKIGVLPAHEGYLELRVREPEPWIPGTTSHVGLAVTRSPHDATLDVFWENELELTVFGPKGRQVTPFVRLEDARGEEIYSAQVCPPMDLPILPPVWKRRFLEFLRRENAGSRYLEAFSGILMIEGQELGQFIIRFEHEALPVRWVLRQQGEGFSLRLVDETGQKDGDLKSFLLPMESPTKIESLEVDRACSGLDIRSPGGLYVAQNGTFNDAVVVSTGLSGSGLEGLGVQPIYGRIHDDPKAIEKQMRILRYWMSARLAGFLANARRRQVVDGMLTRLYGALAGQDWGREEDNFASANDPYHGFNRLQRLLDHRGGFPIVLRRDAATVAGGRKAVSEWYADLSARYGVCSDQSLCSLAIDIACRPQDVPHIYRESLHEKLQIIMKNPLLLRGARLVALRQALASGGTPELLPRWD